MFFSCLKAFRKKFNATQNGRATEYVNKAYQTEDDDNCDTGSDLDDDETFTDDSSDSNSLFKTEIKPSADEKPPIERQRKKSVPLK